MSEKCPLRNGKNPDPSGDITSYYDCAGGVGTLKKCPDRCHVFVVKQKQCDWPPWDIYHGIHPLPGCKRTKEKKEMKEETIETEKSMKNYAHAP